MERLHIQRAWAHDYIEDRTFTLEELKDLRDTLGFTCDAEGFTYFITGLTDDEYADQAGDIMKDLYHELSAYDEDEYKLVNAYIRAMKDPDFLTCYTIFRLWNTHLTREEAEAEWESSCLLTLEGLIEE